MLIPLQEILNKYNIHPKGVIHVGAHWAEEHHDYLLCGITNFIYFEPCRDAYEIIMKLNLIADEVKVFNYACGAYEGKIPMYVSHKNQGQSNSILKPELHLVQHPEIVFDDAEVVEMTTLDSIKMIDRSKYDMLVMDVQGYEGEVLKGATETLKHINIIYTEVNRGQTYSGNMEIDEMDEFLKPFGFERVETYWPSENWSWGDCIYLKQKTLTSEDIDSL